MFLFFRKTWIPVGWLLVSHLAMLWPKDKMPDEKIEWFPHFDKLVHFGIYGGIVFSLFAWLILNGKINPQKKWGWGIALAALATLDGLLVEILQRTPFINRDYDLADVLFDSIGAILGLAVVMWFYRKFWAIKKPL